MSTSTMHHLSRLLYTKASVSFSSMVVLTSNGESYMFPTYLLPSMNPSNHRTRLLPLCNPSPSSWAAQAKPLRLRSAIYREYV